MNYSIVRIDISSSEHLPGLYRLLSETFNFEVPTGRLEEVTVTESSSPGLYLAAIDGGEVIGFNAFISHDLIFGDSKVNAYQSCWTATSSAHRGKKIFQNLINTAKEILSEQGAAFIFGFPNDNSQPIFTKKLGFREIGSLKWQVPNVSLLFDRYVAASVPSAKNALLQNDRQLIQLKQKRSDELPVVVEVDGSLIWAVSRTKEKAGLRMKYLDIGGVMLRETAHRKVLLRELSNREKGVRYFQMTTTEGNTFNELFRGLKPAQTNDLIVFDLNFDSTDVHFNFFGGVRDVF